MSFIFSWSVILISAVWASSTVYHDPRGYKIEMPSGWSVSTNQMGPIRALGPRGQTVYIHPNYFREPLNDASAANLHQAQGQLVFGSAQWERVQAQAGFLRAEGEMMSETGASYRVISILTWAPNTNFYVAYFGSFLQSAFSKEAPIVLSILNSFSFSPDPAKGIDQLRWTPWSDPKELAFSLPAPWGWPRAGGLIRSAPHRKVATWNVHAPDHSIQLFSGDADLAGYMQPQSVAIKKYQTAQKFLQEYIPQHFGASCSPPAYMPLPLWEKSLANEEPIPWLQRVISPTVSAGQAQFRCVRPNGEVWRGLVRAVTDYRLEGATATWSVRILHGYLARQEYEPLGDQLLTHMIKYFAWDPGWRSREQGRMEVLNEPEAATQRQAACSNVLLGGQPVFKTHWNFQGPLWGSSLRAMLPEYSF